MSKTMKSLRPPLPVGLTLTVTVNPLSLIRGAVKVRRGGLHGTAKRPKRAASKRSWLKEQSGPSD